MQKEFRKITVFSAFGWADQGADTIKRMGMEDMIAKWFYSEFDPYPSKLAAANFPDHVHVGDVTKVYYKEKTGWVYFGEWQSEYAGKIDFLIGWPPCQDLSIAGKRVWLEGSRSSLFWEFVRLRDEMKPEFIFMENVASMPKEAFDTINETLWFVGVKRNAAVVSAQSRKRYYWFGKRNADGTYSRFDTREPEDRGIVLRDILEEIPFDATNAKGEPLWKPVPEKYLAVIAEKIAKFAELKTLNEQTAIGNDSGKWFCVDANYSKVWLINSTNGLRTTVIGQFRRTNLRIHAEQEKVCTLTANMGTGGNNVPVIFEPYCLNPKVDGKQPSLADRIYHDEAKATAVTTSFITNVVRIPEATKKWFVEIEPGQCVDMAQANSKTRRGRLMIDKTNALTCAPDIRLDETDEVQYLWRKLTVRECARLQGFSEEYDFSAVSASRAYKAIGNSWQGDQIEDFWKYLAFFPQNE